MQTPCIKADIVCSYGLDKLGLRVRVCQLSNSSYYFACLVDEDANKVVYVGDYTSNFLTADAEAEKLLAL